MFSAFRNESTLDVRVTPFRDHRSRFLAGRQGIALFLLSLGMLFGASLVGFFIVRILLARREMWPADLPPLPNLLWVSTLVLIVSSVTMQWALNSARRDDGRGLRIGMSATLALGLAFLLLQVRCWLSWMEPISQRWSNSDEFRFALTGFYMLTMLHALHVIGGLIPMAIVARNAMAGVYSREYHPGVQYSAMYWHFLGAVWIVLLLSLKIGL